MPADYGVIVEEFLRRIATFGEGRMHDSELCRFVQLRRDLRQSGGGLDEALGFCFSFRLDQHDAEIYAKSPAQTSFGSCIFVDGFAWPGSLSKYKQ